MSENPLAEICSACESNLTCPTAYRNCPILDIAENFETTNRKGAKKMDIAELAIYKKEWEVELAKLIQERLHLFTSKTGLVIESLDVDLSAHYTPKGVDRVLLTGLKAKLLL
jgi:hypothetical protein